ncbi:hypothetical protein CEXT_372941 [Caerostris extrusa]|uniref:Uncharacterized protein n=1 Tax=Caerostris extrusa TaxID=172846 RepID=A0AAV4UBI1_CAEEX|nr:hypothetical protein CEXT_372941 [Caerostris extrusa]
MTIIATSIRKVITERSTAFSDQIQDKDILSFIRDQIDAFVKTCGCRVFEGERQSITREDMMRDTFWTPFIKMSPLS